MTNEFSKLKIFQISQIKNLPNPAIRTFITALGLLTLLNAQPVNADDLNIKASESGPICFDCNTDTEKESQEEFTRESVRQELKFNKNLNQIIGFINKYGKTRDELKQDELKIVSSYIPMVNGDIKMVSDSGISMKICDLDLSCITKYIDLISSTPAEQKEILDVIKSYRDGFSVENDNFQEQLAKLQTFEKIVNKFNLATEKMSLFSGQNGYYITHDASCFLPISIIQASEGEKRVLISVDGKPVDIGYLKEGRITGSIAADGERSAAVVFQNIHEFIKKPQK